MTGLEGSTVANDEQLAVLARGLEAWNEWRKAHPREPIDLSGADLRSLEIGVLPALRRADEARGLLPKGVSWSFIYNEIIGWEVMPIDLRGADLRRANLDGVELIKAECRGADFSGATLKGANLHRADLTAARFVDADLSGADVRGADLSMSLFVRTRVDGADLGHSSVHGISVWDLQGVAKDETSLLVTGPGEQDLRTDGLALAQLMHFLIRNEHASRLIETVTARLVLILGNFKAERMAVLDVVREALRVMGFMPMIFDFAGPKSKDTTGTVETLARLARFVIADLTDPSSVPHELATTVPYLRTTPVIFLRAQGATGYSMADDLKAYTWVLGEHRYETSDQLVTQLPNILRRAGALADSLQTPRAR